LSKLSSLALCHPLSQALDLAGFVDATPVQTQSIPAALSGADLLVTAPTGSGKTLAFLLPMLNRFLTVATKTSAIRGLILLPTRELAQQTRVRLEQLTALSDIRSALVIGGNDFKVQQRALLRLPQIVIATPGRLLEQLENHPQLLSEVEFLVLDEADRLLDLGFSDAVSEIIAHCSGQRQNLLFSATFDQRGLAAISRDFNEPRSISVESPRRQHRDIDQQMVLADDVKHKQKLVAALIGEGEGARAMVFCNSRVQCEQLCHVLRYLKIESRFIHGDIPQKVRSKTLQQFRDREVQVLVATDLAARGLDIDGIDLVINFNVAHSGDEHQHRCGRTGRAGQRGLAVTLVNSDDWGAMSSIERYLSMRFERRAVGDLKAHYRGPKKLKASGKAAGPKKKKAGLKTTATKKRGLKGADKKTKR
jgi:superfamily II DNA/RNA helicase